MSGLGALYEIDLKKIIALSTLRQLGVIIIILSVGKLEITFFHLVSHAIFKAILFLCAGVVIHNLNGRQDLRYLNLMWKLSPVISIIIILGSFSLIGLPFLRGFYSKDLILEYLYLINNSLFLLIIIILRTMFTVIYSFRLFYFLVLKRGVIISYLNYKDLNGIIYPMMFISLIVVFLGSFFNWRVFFFPVFLNLNFKVKILNLFLIILGIYIFINQFFF